jgi:predicted nucleic acid-binding protein
MIVLLDTNIIMDALQERQPFDASAKEILRNARNGKIKCCFTANAATDIFYLYKKARGLQSARSALEYLLKNYGVVSVTQEDCLNALSLPIDDFEDALVSICAKKAGADYIVTRDDKFMRNNLPVPIISPNELLNILHKQEPPIER